MSLVEHKKAGWTNQPPLLCRERHAVATRDKAHAEQEQDVPGRPAAPHAGDRRHRRRAAIRTHAVARLLRGRAG